jgi:putative membrane protein (TIGR04086 family)
MVRSIGAVIVGLLYALAGIWLTQMILWFGFPEESGPEGSESIPEARLALGVVCTFASAVVAGFMAAHVSRSAELAHGLALGAVLVVFLGLTTLVFETEPAPPWYQLALPGVALPATMLGAYLRARLPRRPPPAPPKSAG